MRILLAIDGSSFSEAAVEEVGRRPWPSGSEVKVISVIEPPLVPMADGWAPPAEYYVKLEEASVEQAGSTVNRALDRLRDAQPSLTLTSELLNGSARNVILDEAESWGADLIVVGSHGYRGLTRFLLGSVSQAVASHANCSVEIVRTRKKAEA